MKFKHVLQIQMCVSFKRLQCNFGKEQIFFDAIKTSWYSTKKAQKVYFEGRILFKFPNVKWYAILCLFKCKVKSHDSKN